MNGLGQRQLNSLERDLKADRLKTNDHNSTHLFPVCEEEKFSKANYERVILPQKSQHV